MVCTPVVLHDWEAGAGGLLEPSSLGQLGQQKVFPVLSRLALNNWSQVILLSQHPKHLGLKTYHYAWLRFSS
jgi:hypothetical protein